MLKGIAKLAMVVCLLANVTAKAQIIPKAFTLKSHPINETRSFLLTEFYVNRQFEHYTLPQRNDWERGAVFGWELGYMRNLDEHWAIGASVFLNGSDDRTQFGVKPRARYWLAKNTSVDFAVGPILKTFNDDYTSENGIASHIAINASNWLAFTLGVEYSHVKTARFHLGEGVIYSFSGNRTSISGGARIGAVPGIVVGTVGPIIAMFFAVLFINPIEEG